MALLSAVLFAAPAEIKPEFEVADVHASPRITWPIVAGPFYGGGRYELRFASMLDLIRTAYDLPAESIFGGPSWLEMDRFDVFAIAPAGSTAESRRLMLQALLAGRFKLALHNDTRPMAAYALTSTGHPKLEEADGTGEGGCHFTFQNAPSRNGVAPGTPIELPVFLYSCRNTSLAALAEALPTIQGAGSYFGKKPVVDRTGLKGSWNFGLRFTPNVPAGLQVTGEKISIIDALEKQLGLKLEPSTVPMPVVVVDSVNQKPTENSPEALQKLPAPPTEFEVASVKPSAPDARGGRGGGARPDLRNGRLYLPGITLQNLVLLAWDVPSEEQLAGAPKWMDEDRFDILAKAPAGVALGDLDSGKTGMTVNIDALRPMIRALVQERFQLQAHLESRPLNAYTLVAKKPKLEKAAADSRTKCEQGGLTDSKGARNGPAMGRVFTCHNVTMAQFAKLLPGIAPGYLRTEVVDATGLDGGWDFTFSFSPAGFVQPGRAPRGDGGAPAPGNPAEASDPTGALTLAEALSSELGLKLETQKRALPVLVIDHVERKPTEN